MKCPKCGYNSFDYLDSCKKCGKDLIDFKQRFGIKSVLFPGATGISAKATEEEDLLAVEAPDLAAATAMGATAAAAAGGASKADGGSADGDDFGFDFMGESSEEEDLSFDDLFEEAPEEEDMEESLEGPKSEPAGGAQATADGDFAFDMPDADDELEDDFGFDAESIAEGDKMPKKSKGSKEGPTDPFDLPESPPAVGAPEISPPASIVSTVAATTSRQSDDQFDSPQSPPPAAAEEDEYVFDCSAPEAEEVAEVVAQDPVATVEEPHHSEALPVSIGGRFASFVYDAVILVLVGLSFVIAAEVTLSRETGPLPTLDTLIDLSVPYFLILFTLTFGYFTLFHFLAGQTPGKMLTGLRVETATGEPLVFSQAFLRSVGGLLQLLPLGLGYLLVLFSGDGRGWNDRLAGTRVVVVTEKK